MANITFTIPSVLNAGGGEKKTEISADSYGVVGGRVATGVRPSGVPRGTRKGATGGIMIRLFQRCREHGSGRLYF